MRFSSTGFCEFDTGHSLVKSRSVMRRPPLPSAPYLRSPDVTKRTGVPDDPQPTRDGYTKVFSEIGTSVIESCEVRQIKSSWCQDDFTSNNKPP